MRIHAEPKYILVMTISFQSFEPAEEFYSELVLNPDVYGIKHEGRVVKYHTFSKDSAMSLAKNFEARWMEQQIIPIESKRIESSGAGMIRYGDISEEESLVDVIENELSSESPSE